MIRTPLLSASLLLTLVSTDLLGQGTTTPRTTRQPTTRTPTTSSGTATTTKRAGTTARTSAAPRTGASAADSGRATATPIASKTASRSDSVPAAQTISTTSVRPDGSSAGPQADTVGTVKPMSWMISVNPLGLLYGGLTGEAEKRLNPKNSIAAALNFWSAYGANYTSVDFKYRIYQKGADDFRGLSYGPMVGFQRVGVTLCDALDESCSATGVTLGGTVDYVLPLSKDQRWTGAIGGGVKTSLGTSELTGVQFTYPFIRVGIGYTFPRK